MRLFVLALENLLFPFGALGIIFKFLVSARRGLLTGLGAEISQRLGLLPAQAAAKLSGKAVLWVHAASAGEMTAASALIVRLKERPKTAILATAMTSSGRERARALAAVDHASLAPADFFPAAAGFIHAIHPRALILVETELWPHLIELSFQRGATICLVNARMTEKSFARYRRLRPFIAPFLERLAIVCAQTQSDAERFLRLGARAEAMQVCGNMKYDLPPPASDGRLERTVQRLGWGEAPVFVAGSTHPVEEEQVLAGYLAARAACPSLRLILAPRHPERAAHTSALLLSRGIPFARLSALEAAGETPRAEALILDTLGLLGAAYRLARAAFVGGTLVPIGGHNLLEPALAGTPVLFGPHTEHIPEPAHALESAGGGFCVEDGARLGAILGELLADPARARAQGALARRTAGAFSGAVSRTLAALDMAVPDLRAPGAP